LNQVLVSNSSSTFFIRVIDDSFKENNVLSNDVLIVDKSLSAKADQLVVATVDDSFKIIKIDNNSKIELNIWGVITYIIKSVK